MSNPPGEPEPANVTDDQVRALRRSAARAGNRELHEICNRALGDTVTAPRGVPATAGEARARLRGRIAEAENSCPFCARVAAGDFDYADSDCVAFEPLNPVVPGHFLVVPRLHVASAADAPVLAGVAAKFAAWMAVDMDLAAFNLITSAGAAATQTVPHLHWHVVPRLEDDGLALPWTRQEKGITP